MVDHVTSADETVTPDSLRDGDRDRDDAREGFHIFWGSASMLRHSVDKMAKGHLPGSISLPSSLFVSFSLRSSDILKTGCWIHATGSVMSPTHDGRGTSKDRDGEVPLATCEAP